MSEIDVLAGETCFATSGTTGAPRRWTRRPEQMLREVELIGDSVIGPVDFVINYAPPQHLFGALFGQWFPQLSGVRTNQAWTDPFNFPDVARGSRVLVVCVPMAWNLLRRNWRSVTAASSIVALHSTAAPPATAYDLVRGASHVLRAHEILGSTETGGVAHRPMDLDGAPWRGFPDVRFIRNRETAAGSLEDLAIKSPRLACPEGAQAPPPMWATGDVVKFIGPDTFRLVGRRSSLVKVNGLKVHLSRIDEHLSAQLPGADFVSVPTPDALLTGEGYVVFWSCRDQRVRLSNVRSVLRDFPSPARIVEIADIDRHGPA